MGTLRGTHVDPKEARETRPPSPKLGVLSRVALGNAAVKPEGSKGSQRQPQSQNQHQSQWQSPLRSRADPWRVTGLVGQLEALSSPPGAGSRSSCPHEADDRLNSAMEAREGPPICSRHIKPQGHRADHIHMRRAFVGGLGILGVAWVLGSSDWHAYWSEFWITARAQLRASTDGPAGRPFSGPSEEDR
jgi:hypothetical protein